MGLRIVGKGGQNRDDNKRLCWVSYNRQAYDPVIGLCVMAEDALMRSLCVASDKYSVRESEDECTLVAGLHVLADSPTSLYASIVDQKGDLSQEHGELRRTAVLALESGT